jgi:hypothetical protein
LDVRNISIPATEELPNEPEVAAFLGLEIVFVIAAGISKLYTQRCMRIDETAQMHVQK